MQHTERMSLERPKDQAYPSLYDTLVHSFFQEPTASISVVDISAASDPGGRPYFAVTTSSRSDGNIHNLLHSDLTRLTLTKGKGIAFFDEQKAHYPLSGYRYGELLSLAIFGSLRPDPRFDVTAHPSASINGVPTGTKIRQSTPHPALFPDYAANAISEHLRGIAGRQLAFIPQLIEYPDLDALIRFKIVIDGYGQMPPSLKEAVGQRIAWCLPYTVLLS